MLSIGTPQMILGILHTLKQRALERESTPESKFDVFHKTLGKVPKPMTEQKKKDRDLKEALEFRQQLIRSILNRK